MKEISNQLYGLEAELDSTSETNGTSCFCVDTGTVFVAYGGIWYEQRNVYWKVGGVAESDLSGYSRYMPSAAAVDDLVCFNAQDTGVRYVAYCGHWFAQPIPWADVALLNAAAAQSPAELPAVTSDDNGDVLTVVDGAWGKAAPGGGGATVVHYSGDTTHLDMTAEELLAAAKSSFTILVFVSDTEETAMPLVYAYRFENSYTFVFGTEIEQAYAVFTADSGSGYPDEGGGEPDS